jgi:hypothetical protein
MTRIIEEMAGIFAWVVLVIGTLIITGSLGLASFLLVLGLPWWSYLIPASVIFLPLLGYRAVIKIKDWWEWRHWVRKDSK